MISHQRDDKRTSTYPRSCAYARPGSSSRHITTLERQPRHNMLAAAAAPLPSTPPPESHCTHLKIVMQAGSFSLPSPNLSRRPPGRIAATSPELTQTESARQPVTRRDLSSPGVVPHLHSPKHVLLSTLLALSLSLSLYHSVSSSTAWFPRVRAPSIWRQ